MNNHPDLNMTKKKHPANRFERLKIKEKIKQFGKGSNDRSGHVRRKLELEEETVKELLYEQHKELDHALSTEQVRG